MARSMLLWCLTSIALIQRLPGTHGQGFQVTEQDRQWWQKYTGIAVGVPLSGLPAILSCGYYSPAVMAPIKYGNPDVVPGWNCSYSNPNLRNFNHPSYWQRPMDLPFDKFWGPTVIKTWNVDIQPLHYQNCNNTMTLPKLKSDLPFTAYWFSNAAVGPFWRRYLEARNMGEGRMWRADLCISVWFNRNGVADEEITLKVTDIDETLGPYDIKVEPYMKKTYFNRPVVWTFTKCWGNAVLNPRYGRQAMTGSNLALRITGKPVYRSCLPWIVRSYRAQAARLRATDPWYNASVKISSADWHKYPTVQKPNLIPKNPNGTYRLV